MEVTVSKFTDEHYPLILEWWQTHGHPALGRTVLSPFGVVCSIDNVPTAMSFMYLWTGTTVAQIAWTTTRPEAGGKQKLKAVNECMKALIDTAEMNKRTDVICFSSSKGLTKIMQRHGLHVGQSHDILAGTFGVDNG